MDLEISEPIDFSSGDQHLIRKASDKRAETQSGQPPRATPSPEHQATQGNPHPKAADRGNIYVVQISDETSPVESSTAAGNAFTDDAVRRGELKEITF